MLQVAHSMLLLRGRTIAHWPLPLRWTSVRSRPRCTVPGGIHDVMPLTAANLCDALRVARHERAVEADGRRLRCGAAATQRPTARP
jgi:hypothetical protein